MMVVEGTLETLVQYPVSDCRNGGVIKVSDGPQVVNTISSHHYLLMTGHNGVDIDILAKVFDLKIEEI